MFSIKKYIAFVSGLFEPQSGIIEFPIVRKDNSIIERVVDINNEAQKNQASTIYKTMQYYPKYDYSQVEFQLLSGKTHQIRVHSNHLGHPLIGDTLYGKPSDLISRQALHCYKLSFINPLTNKAQTIESNLPVSSPSAVRGAWIPKCLRMNAERRLFHFTIPHSFHRAFNASSS